ncbi:transcriptional regulator [Eggerthellaceae bacterium zg-893]|nr:transcriptional regulator [Eggerthellaceae bacterium zg-893]
MNSLEAIKALNDVSAYQRGMFTSAQARRLGVERYTLSRLEKGGFIERVARGVYRMGGAPSMREEDVYATWLSLVPDREPGVSRALERTPVAMGATSAWLQELGEIGPEPLEFCCSLRKQTQRRGIVIRKRLINAVDVVYAAGMPATSPARTVLDLVDGGEDLSLVAGVLGDALARGLVVDIEGLASEIDRRGRKVGLPRDASLYALLEKGR